MSWYRLYRPQTVASLHIAPVREAFGRILQSGEFSHAYLLTGPKGTGKTSAARILAKVLNCEKNRQTVEALLVAGSVKTKKTALVEPCNVCATCVAITSGSSLCVSEMDAASNRGIDDIRALTERIGLSAGDGAISVIIIDEVHMLTTEAFNALLKVLEEPPAHVVFILATTDAQKMPQTVISRCEVVQYRKATSEEIVDALTSIAEKETIEIGDGVLLRIVSYADGSFRDGVKAFEQVAKGKSTVTLEDVTNILGISVSELAENLVQLLAKRDYGAVVTVFSKIESDGLDALTIQKEVLRSLHARMIAAPAAKNPHFPAYVALVKSLNVPPSLSLPFPGLPFEIACLEWCLGSQVYKEDDHTDVTVQKVAPSPKLHVVSNIHNVAVTTTTAQDDSLRKKKVEIAPEQVEIAQSVEVEEEVATIQVPFTTVLEQWHVVLRAVRERNNSLEVFLKTTKPLGIENNTLTLEVFYQFHKDQLALDRNLTIIEDVLSHTFAARVKVRLMLGSKALEKVASPDNNLSGVVDLSFVKAAQDAFLS